MKNVKAMNRMVHVPLAVWLFGAVAVPHAGAARVSRRGHQHHRHKQRISPRIKGEADEDEDNPLKGLEDIARTVDDLENRQKAPHVAEGHGTQGGLLTADFNDLLRETVDDLRECRVIHQYAEPLQVISPLESGVSFHPRDRAAKLHLHSAEHTSEKDLPPLMKPGAIWDDTPVENELSLAIDMYAILSGSVGMVQVIPHGVVAKWTSKQKVPIAGFLCMHSGSHLSAPVLHALPTPCVPTALGRDGQPLDPSEYHVFIGTTRVRFNSKQEAFAFCEDYTRRIAQDMSATVWDASSLGEMTPNMNPTVQSFVALTRKLTSPTGWTKGIKTVLVVVMDWKLGDQTLVPYSQQEADPIPKYKSKIFPAVDEAFRKMSYGQFSIKATFVPEVIRYTRNRVAYTARQMPFPSLYNAAMESLEGTTSDFRFDDYDLVFIIAPQVQPIGTKGVAFVGQKGAMCNGCEALSDSFKIMVAVHELGHNLGLFHASSASLEYGNIFDWMGNYPDFAGLHYGLGYKWSLGWVSNDNIFEISDGDLSGLSAEVIINPYDTNTEPGAGQMAGVHISLSRLRRDVWISFRSTVTRGKRGVYVTYQDKDHANSELVDAACTSISQQDAVLKEGWTFMEKSHQVAVKVLSVTSEAAKVHIFAVAPGDAPKIYGQPSFTDGLTKCPASCQDADFLVPEYSCRKLKGVGYCTGGVLTMMGHRYTIGEDICPSTCDRCKASSSSGGSSTTSSALGCTNVNVRINGKSCNGAAQAGWCGLETKSGHSVGKDLCPESCNECPRGVQASDEPFEEPEIADTAGTISFVLGGAQHAAPMAPGPAVAMAPAVASPAPAPGAEFDCEAGLWNWEKGWSEAKKKWCCKNEGKGWQGCKEKQELFDCEAGLPKWKTGWSEAKKEWCCENKQKGCEDAFDCDAGLAKWETGWSEDKKEWCCAKENKGCQAPLPAPAPAPAQDELFDCDAGFAKWEAGWSEEKKEWCCENKQKGCEEKDEDEPFDCEAGLQRWETGWSDLKKEWCCENKNKGCKEKLFDCEAGLKRWEKGWSDAKKEWCCKNEDKGCEEDEEDEDDEKDEDDKEDDSEEDDGKDSDDNETEDSEDEGDIEEFNETETAINLTTTTLHYHEKEVEVQHRGKPPLASDACQDDPYWIDSEGDTCQTYRETIAAGKWSTEDACLNDGARMYCRETCHTCVLSPDTCADMSCVGEFVRASGRCEQCADHPRHCATAWFRKDCPRTCGECTPSDVALNMTAPSSVNRMRGRVDEDGQECEDDECVADWKVKDKCVTCKSLGKQFCHKVAFRQSCKRTCDMCLDGGVPKTCADVFSTHTCRTYNERGWCNRKDTRDAVRVQCPLSCGICEPDVQVRVPSSIMDDEDDEVEEVDEVDKRKRKDDVEKEPCRCKSVWSSSHHEGCEEVYGCPEKSCDGFNKTWCEVANPGCATEKEGSAPWTYCTPTGDPVEAEATAEERSWWNPFRYMVPRDAYSAPKEPPKKEAPPKKKPGKPPRGPEKTPALAAPGSLFRWQSSGAASQEVLTSGLLVAMFTLTYDLHGL